MDRFDALPGDMATVERVALGSAALPDNAFAQALEAIIPHLRGYARSLSRSPAQADDLVQDALLRAWSARARCWCVTSQGIPRRSGGGTR